MVDPLDNAATNIVLRDRKMNVPLGREDAGL